MYVLLLLIDRFARQWCLHFRPIGPHGAQVGYGLGSGTSCLGWTVAKAVITGPDLRGAGGAEPKPRSNRRHPTKPFQLYFSLMIDAYETTT